MEIIGNPLTPSELASKIDTIVQKSSPQSSTELINAEKTSINNQDNSKPQNEENANTTPDNSNNEASKNNDGSAETNNSAEISQEVRKLHTMKIRNFC